MKKQIKAKITKKQLQACHRYIFQQLTELALKHWSMSQEVEKHPAIKEKNGNIFADMKKVKK